MSSRRAVNRGTRAVTDGIARGGMVYPVAVCRCQCVNRRGPMDLATGNGVTMFRSVNRDVDYDTVPWTVYSVLP